MLTTLCNAFFPSRCERSGALKKYVRSEFVILATDRELYLCLNTESILLKLQVARIPKHHFSAAYGRTFLMNIQAITRFNAQKSSLTYILRLIFSWPLSYVNAVSVSQPETVWGDQDSQIMAQTTFLLSKDEFLSEEFLLRLWLQCLRRTFSHRFGELINNVLLRNFRFWQTLKLDNPWNPFSLEFGAWVPMSLENILVFVNCTVALYTCQ